jgi:hypothetical protein
VTLPVEVPDIGRYKGPFGGKREGMTTPPSLVSRRGLDWFNFFLSDIQTGFGPFISVYLTSQKWTQTDIGLAHVSLLPGATLPIRGHHIESSDARRLRGRLH